MVKTVKYLKEKLMVVLVAHTVVGTIVGTLLEVVFWNSDYMWHTVIVAILGAAIGILVFFLNLGGFNWRDFGTSLRRMFLRVFWGVVFVVIAVLAAFVSGLGVLQESPQLPAGGMGLTAGLDPATIQVLIGVLIGFGVTFVSTLLILLVVVALWRQFQKSSSEYNAKIAEFEKKAHEAEKQALETGRARPLWDVARYTLEAHFSRNLRQNNYIFWTSVLLIFVGFGTILYAVWLGIRHPDTIESAVIAGLGGVITEFVGTTCLSVYRSTVEESLKYTASLERINTIGVTLQILDDTDVLPEELNKNRTEIAKLLISQMSAIQ